MLRICAAIVSFRFDPSPPCCAVLVRALSSRNVTTGDCFQGIMGSSSVTLRSRPAQPERWKPVRSRKLPRGRASIALGISAVVANEAPLLPSQRLGAAARADPSPVLVGARSKGAVADGERLGCRGRHWLLVGGRGQKASADHVRLDDAADGGEQAGYVAPPIHCPPWGSNTALSSSTTKETSPPRRKMALIMRVSATVHA